MKAEIEIEEAATVRAAIDMADRLKPDVLILDHNFPDGIGLEVLREVRRKNTSRIIIALTNFAEAQLKRKYFLNGANYFLDKSKDFEKVLKICERMS